MPSCSGDTCDVLAHLSVRSRNMHVLFATCYDASQLGDLEAMAGKMVACETTPAGSVKWREADAAEVAAHAAGARQAAAVLNDTTPGSPAPPSVVQQRLPARPPQAPALPPSVLETL